MCYTASENTNFPVQKSQTQMIPVLFKILPYLGALLTVILHNAESIVLIA